MFLQAISWMYAMIAMSRLPGNSSKVLELLDEEMKAVAMVGMYSGMRSNEICSLQISNIKTVEGVWCFEVTEGKTRNAAAWFQSIAD
jgi:integrase